MGSSDLENMLLSFVTVFVFRLKSRCVGVCVKLRSCVCVCVVCVVCLWVICGDLYACFLPLHGYNLFVVGLSICVSILQSVSVV